MKYLEIGLFGLSIISLSLFLINWPSGAIFSILQLGALSSIYFYLGFAVFNSISISKIFKKTSYQGISKLRIVGAITTGISLSILVIGILFKMMAWPGASFTLTIGTFTSFLILVIASIKINSKKSDYYKLIIYRTAFFVTIGTILLILPPMTWINIKYKDHPRYIEAYKNALENPDSEEAWKKVDEEKENINNSL